MLASAQTYSAMPRLIHLNFSQNTKYFLASQPSLLCSCFSKGLQYSPPHSSSSPLHHCQRVHHASFQPSNKVVFCLKALQIALYRMNFYLPHTPLWQQNVAFITFHPNLLFTCLWTLERQGHNPCVSVCHTQQRTLRRLAVDVWNPSPFPTVPVATPRPDSTICS